MSAQLSEDPPHPCFIQDPVHGFIEIPRKFLRIIDTPQFKRLQNLKQLGATYVVYPGATHTRFEHSLGVMHLAGRAMDQLRRKNPELKIDSRLKELVMAAGLLHDIGHGPFSHMFDSEFLKNQKYYPELKGKSHEDFSVAMINHIVKAENNPLEFETVETEEGEVFSEKEFVQSLINPKAFSEERKKYERKYNGKWIYQIISNEESGLDVDKMDYLLRDARALRMGDISMPIERVLLNMEVKLTKDLGESDTPEQKANQIAFPVKLCNDIYMIFNMRYNLHKNVYTHKTIKAVEYMMLDAMLMVDKELEISKSCMNMAKYAHLTDSVINQIERLRGAKYEKARKLICRIQRRQLYVSAYQLIVPQKLYEIWNKNTKKKELITKEEIMEELRNSLVTEEDIVIQHAKLNYGSKEKNPLDSIVFFRHNKWKGSTQVMQPGLPSHMIQENIKHQEHLLRVYLRVDKSNKTKGGVDYKKIGATEDAMRRWSEREENKKIVKPIVFESMEPKRFPLNRTTSQPTTKIERRVFSTPTRNSLRRPSGATGTPVGHKMISQSLGCSSPGQSGGTPLRPTPSSSRRDRPRKRRTKFAMLSPIPEEKPQKRKRNGIGNA